MTLGTSSDEGSTQGFFDKEPETLLVALMADMKGLPNGMALSATGFFASRILTIEYGDWIS